MKVYISVDIEGITGLVAWAQCGRPRSEYYDYAFARRMMTHDTSAAIEGARRAGATQITVKDSHDGMRNLLIDELPAGIELISGSGSEVEGMVHAIDGSYDALVLVGYHAMAGTPKGIMEHTMTGALHGMWVNGEPIGEIGLSAGIAGHFGVPVAALSSDVAGCEEAQALLPGVHTCAVKEGYGRYMGKLNHPSETYPAIVETVEQGLLGRKHLKPFAPSSPMNLCMEFNRSEEIDAVGCFSSMRRVGGHKVEGTFNDFLSLSQAASVVFELASIGKRADD